MDAALKALAVLGGLLGMVPAAAAATAAPQLFGTAEFQVKSLAALPQWAYASYFQIARERPIYRACAEAVETCPTKSAAAWQAMLKSEVGQRPFDQIQVVNQFLNQWQYKTDQQNYGQRPELLGVPHLGFSAASGAGRLCRSRNT